MQAQQSADQGYNNQMQAQANKGKYGTAQQMQAQQARGAAQGRYASDAISAQSQMQRTEGSNGGETAQLQMQKDEASGSDQLQMQRNSALPLTGESNRLDDRDAHEYRYEAGKQAQMQREGGANVRSKNREFRSVKYELDEEAKRSHSEEQVQMQKMSDLTRHLKEKAEART
eukprot:GHVU01197078.1.p1 GENE.GHVU01197078.1~~GHVU01197078.1.p1  ORF type:complete len:172 (+),score=43.12 GHVU01197078.1:2-517(+)